MQAHPDKVCSKPPLSDVHAKQRGTDEGLRTNSNTKHAIQGITKINMSIQCIVKIINQAEIYGQANSMSKIGPKSKNTMSQRIQWNYFNCSTEDILQEKR